ncbi:Putative ATP-dependent RNA helicase DHX57 at C-terminar half [Coccomyxa sp. Obi]|nr:Putative ATP-dependent RNA helicase DHX57 at C-terminar half [Coccomyxa sp. Obi]
MSGKKGGRKAAASAAAHAASKRKTSAIEISADNESRVRDALKGLDIISSKAKNPAGKATAEELAQVYDTMLGHGFKKEHVQQALQSLAGGNISEEAVLDWLCLHVDPADLPRRFAGAAQSRAAAAGIKVVAKADEAAAAARREQARKAQELQTAWQPPQKPAAKAAPKVDAAALAREKQKARDWILQYAVEDSESDGEGSQGEEQIDDWELWGDPKEIERRKAERARNAMHPEARKELIAEEWATARGEAARAKAAGDKSRQKGAGQVIAGLKREIAQLGLTEAAIEALAERFTVKSAPATPAEDVEEWPDLAAPSNAERGARAGDKSVSVAAENGRQHDAFPPLSRDQGTASGTGGFMEETGLRNDTASMSASADAAKVPSQGIDHHSEASRSASELSLGAKEDQKQASRGVEEDEDIDLGPGMFDEDAAELMTAGVSTAAKSIADMVMPWGGYSGAKKKGSKLKKRPEVVEETKLPKALLQQHCQKMQWPPPRFERLAMGGFRMASAGIRYSATLEMPPTNGRKKKAAPPKTFTILEEDDGWETIQEAQNAAATFVLYNVLQGDEERVAAWRQLERQYQDMWLKWEAQEGEAKQETQDQANEEERQAFINSLISQKQEVGPSLSRAANGSSAKEQASSSGQDDTETDLSVQTPVELTPAQVAESRRMLDVQRRWRGSREGQEWAAKRQQLPVVQVQAGLLAALADHDVVVVGGDTGCGKTTQVPQFLLDAAVEAGQGGACNIVCTQPRRIAAISVAERVATERGEPAPGAAGARVGYHVRLDAASTRDTRLLFCTTGILLRRLASEPHLASVSHVIVDEVHERTLQSDFLMALLKDILAKRRARGRPLKVVLMSAMLDSNLFARYYGDCPVLVAGGRTFPVEHYFLEDTYELTGYRLDAESPCAMRDYGHKERRRQLEKAVSQGQQSLVKAGWGDDTADVGALNPHYDPDIYADFSVATRRNLARLDENRIDYDLLEELVAHIDASYEEGAILVFLPGLGEITAMYERLTASRAHREGGLLVLPLHSSVSPQEQRRVFERPPPRARKVVLATNIAETSLTIEDVVYVVDSGKLKERRYDASRGMSLLVEDWVSRASALQRRGRAGRVRPGRCFGLYTRNRFEHRMRKYQAPEMARVPLEELVLQIHLLGLGPAAEFLSKVLEPPPTRSVTGAVVQLQTIGALTSSEQLTPLGRNLAQLPVDAKVGKLLLLGASLGCLSPALTIAACLSYKSPFSAPFEQQDAAMRAKQAFASSGSGNVASGQQSDHLLMVAAFDGWQAAKGQGGRQPAASYARKHMLSGQTLEMLADMRQQFAAMLADIGFVAAPKSAAGRGQAGKSSGGRHWVDERKAAWNAHSSKPAVVKAVLCAALYPNAAVMDEAAGRSARPAWNDGTADVHIHPSSINHPLEAHQFLRPYLVYLEKVRTSRTFLRDCTVVSPMALLLFGGELVVVHEGGYALIDNWIRIRASAPTAVLVKQLRAALDALLEKKAGRPDLDLSAIGGQIVDTIVKLLCDEEASQAWNR